MIAQHGPDSGLERLASTLMDKRALSSDWLPIYRRVPRDLFLPDAIWPDAPGDDRPARRILRSEAPDAWGRAAYADVPIITRWDDGTHTGPGPGTSATSVNPMPSTVFSMLDALGVDDGHDVLEIGGGTGWTAALLCARLGAEHVTSVEADVETMAYATLCLDEAGFVPCVVVGDGVEGHRPRAPYDRIVATCAVGEVPYAWVEQTRLGGVIVTPWETAYGGQAVVRLTVHEDGTASGHFTGTSSLPHLPDQRTHRPPEPAPTSLDEGEWQARVVRSSTTLTPDQMGDWTAVFAIGAQLADVQPWPEPAADDGGYRLWLADTAGTSRATVDYRPGHREFAVHQHGPRHLWDEADDTYHWWRMRGRPGVDRFGLTVDRNGEHVWLNNPDNPVPTNPARLR